MTSTPPIPIILLKTRSQPNDGYEEHFSSPPTPPSSTTTTTINFSPTFIPVLTHAPNTTNLTSLSILLSSRTLKSTYDGMIFTSQRAVEAWSTIVSTIHTLQSSQSPQPHHPLDPDFINDTPFPLYVVGPATATLLAPSLPALASIIPHLNPVIVGEHTGNGAALANFILTHYHHCVHGRKLYTFYEAPRLPFIPLLGAGGENYSRRRLERGDERLGRKGLLFLVGETRRDVIPRMLMGDAGGLEVERRVGVSEVEVYTTGVEEGFERAFGGRLREIEMGEGRGVGVVVVVVFSPQGCESMLRALGLLEEDGRVGEKARGGWGGVDEGGDGGGVRYVIATIGPTTRDYLKQTFGFEADVCATRPSPEGVREGVTQFLKEKGLV